MSTLVAHAASTPSAPSASYAATTVTAATAPTTAFGSPAAPATAPTGTPPMAAAGAASPAASFATRFGYRIKVPLALTGVALLSGVLVALTTYMLVDRHVEANAEAETQRLTGALARALVDPMLRNDVWRAFQAVRAAQAPTSARPGQAADAAAVQVVVLDAQGHVFAAPSPRRHPLGQHYSTLPEPLAGAARRVLSATPPVAARIAARDGGPLVLAEPIVGNEDALLGIVLASHPSALTEAQRASVVRQLVVLGAMAMALVALAGAALGLRMTLPLARLRSAMQAAPRPATGEAAVGADGSVALAEVCRRRDELGELGRSFAQMLQQIQAQQELERHMLEAERLASVGQLSAGIAHEVNNPLGGMLAAIENRRLRGGLDEASERTLALLERGLRQIHSTTQALLHEARSGQHALAEADLQDVALLLRPEADHARCVLEWQLPMPTRAGLAAAPVRQVLLNLTLNAIAAAGRGGRVRASGSEDALGWSLHVANTGAALDEQRLASLIQGLERSGDGRLGLGLWITARVLHTHRGTLTVGFPQPPFTTEVVAAFRWPPAASAASGASGAAAAQPPTLS
jgi:signal transduction histidine kinase